VFVIRVAGNVADTDEIGTIEYGVGHLGSPLVVVMGHTKCGAVTAVVDGAKVHGHIGQLVENIGPAAQKARAANPDLKGPALVSEAIAANVWQSVEDLILKSDEVREKVAEGKVQVVGAVYDIHSGNVQWLGEHPQQSTLVKGEAPKAPPAPVAAAKAHDDSHDSHDAHDAKDTSHEHDAHAPAKSADPHDAHGANDAHDHTPAKSGAPKAESHDGHDAHGDKHGDASDPHGDEHAAATTQPVEAKVGGRNPVMLGVFLVGAAGLSGLIFKFMKTHKAAA
jgi:carbonic anhydrase